MATLIIWLTLTFNILFAPCKYQVQDKITKEYLCGVQIEINGNHIYTDLDGYFTARPSQYAKLNFISYNDTVIELKTKIIYLSPL